MKNRQVVLYEKKKKMFGGNHRWKDRTVNCFVRIQGGKEYKARRESRITEPSVCLARIASPSFF